MRVHIIGIPGSGKSTLATRIAGRLGVEPTDLDDLANPRLDETLAPELRDERRWEICRLAATRIASTPVWVTEGIYCGWTDPLLDAADLVVWLDVPAYVAVWRIVRRHASRSLAGENPHKGLRLLTRFAGDVLRDPRRPAATDAELRSNVGANSRATTRDRLGGYPGKVVRCRTGRDVERVLRRFPDRSAGG